MERQMQGPEVCTVTVRSNRDGEVQKLWEWSTQLWVVTQELRPREDGEKKSQPCFPYFLIFSFFFDESILFLI